MTPHIDTRANVERPEHERPRAELPIVPDLVPEERPWHGSATSEVEHWRGRALAAEAIVERLRRDLARYRVRP
jgi:hypothetical protein